MAFTNRACIEVHTYKYLVLEKVYVIVTYLFQNSLKKRYMQVSNFSKYSNSNRGSIFVCVQLFQFYKYHLKTTIG